MKRLAFALTRLMVILALASVVSACADQEGKVAGFWKGIWHGLISPITFIISIFSKNIRFYEVHNNGGWYNFGFVLGAGLFLGGGILGKKKRGR